MVRCDDRAGSAARERCGDEGSVRSGRAFHARSLAAALAKSEVPARLVPIPMDEGGRGHGGRYPVGMQRSLFAVILGTFTLRFSTGLTGAMLVYYLADLPHQGGPTVSSTVVGVFSALFFAAELSLAPPFGLLSDRLGHHLIMQVGPLFGAIAVVLTSLTTNLPAIGLTRLLEGASTAASVPSILGFIAMATAGDELLRGRAAARFEGATLAVLGAGFVA